MDSQLAAFVAVAEELSFSAAARKLHTSQPAVSQQVQALERRLDAQLLERSHRAVTLTRAGELVLARGREILNRYSELTRLVDDMMHRPIGPLFIGASYTYGEHILPYALAKFREQHPAIRPSIVINNTREVVRQVADGTLDIGITEGSHARSGVQSEAIADDEMVVLAGTGHRFTQTGAITARELAAETWIIREEGSGTREAEDAMFERFGIRPVQTMEFGSTQVIKESVEAGLGITLLSTAAVRKELELGVLQAVPFPPAPIHRQFFVVTRESAFRTQATVAFHNFLRAYHKPHA